MSRIQKQLSSGSSLSVTVAAVGRGRTDPAQILFNQYINRLPWVTRLTEIREIRNLSIVERKNKEGLKLFSALPKNAYIIALDSTGKVMTSKSFAHLIKTSSENGIRDLGFIIGGPDGLEPSLINRANLILSFGSMTWPHMMVRAMLAEQLWRSASIISGHPYHRE